MSADLRGLSLYSKWEQNMRARVNITVHVFTVRLRTQLTHMSRGTRFVFTITSCNDREKRENTSCTQNLSSPVLSTQALNTRYALRKGYLHFPPAVSTASLRARLTLLFSRPTVRNENCKHFKRLWYKCHSREI